ncbi:MAG: hypothetical protein GY855_10910 [candidate division Zixibacteria bacterium]|nr:hypothetical protein [candidate division Zixibacteria bacterium]
MYKILAKSILILLVLSSASVSGNLSFNCETAKCCCDCCKSGYETGWDNDEMDNSCCCEMDNPQEIPEIPIEASIGSTEKLSIINISNNQLNDFASLDSNNYPGRIKQNISLNINSPPSYITNSSLLI